jgi:orotate phosphoribosyltransferase
MIFQDNIVKWIANKNILLLIATVSSGRALTIGIECIEYYGGRLSGVSALYTASPSTLKYKINTLFTSEDIPGYRLFSPSECDLCKAGMKLDAIVSSDGYTKL